MGVRRLIRSWPAYRQLTGPDRLGRGSAARSPQTEGLRARTDAAERVVKSVCPYCAVGCGRQVYVKDGAVVQIEGDQDAPVSRGRLCPKGSATLQLTTGSARRHAVLYRPPYAADWERLDLETAMDMVADRVVETRRRTWEWEHEGLRAARAPGNAGLGGATLDNHSPLGNVLYPKGPRSPVRQLMPRQGNYYPPSGDEPGAEVFPYVVTTHRLTEHFTAGGMSRWSPYLAELQPEFFCEISPEPAAERDLEHGGWATLVTARGAVEARVLVTRRIRPPTVQGRTVHQIGLPFHWGPNDLATGDAADELVAMSLDPNAHIQEDKAVTADIVAGRRPRGPELPRFLAAYRARAGITEQTGAEALR